MIFSGCYTESVLYENIHTTKLSNGFLNHSLDIFTLGNISMTECCDASLTENQFDILGRSLSLKSAMRTFAPLRKFSSSASIPKAPPVTMHNLTCETTHNLSEYDFALMLFFKSYRSGLIRKSFPSGSNCPPSTTMVVPVIGGLIRSKK